MARQDSTQGKNNVYAIRRKPMKPTNQGPLPAPSLQGAKTQRHHQPESHPNLPHAQSNALVKKRQKNLQIGTRTVENTSHGSGTEPVPENMYSRTTMYLIRRVLDTDCPSYTPCAEAQSLPLRGQGREDIAAQAPSSPESGMSGMSGIGIPSTLFQDGDQDSGISRALSVSIYKHL